LDLEQFRFAHQKKVLPILGKGLVWWAKPDKKITVNIISESEVPICSQSATVCFVSQSITGT
jgi:hypothetical protein